jgi:hypothetical protein
MHPVVFYGTTGSICCAGGRYTCPPMKMEQTVFRNVGIYNSDAGELPRRKHTAFRTRRKYEIKNKQYVFSVDTTVLVLILIIRIEDNILRPLLVVFRPSSVMQIKYMTITLKYA